MKKITSILCLLAFAPVSRADWFEVKSVISYNQVIAIRPDAPSNNIKIRIKNLENIEDIQMDRSKVLLSGKSALQLAEDSLLGQLVWIEDLQEESGIYVGTVYLSYEQMIRGYARQRMVGGQTVTPEIKESITAIYNRMMRSLGTAPFPEDTVAPTEKERRETFFQQAFNRATGNGSDDKRNTGNGELKPKNYFTYDVCYTDDYLKAIFVYEALSWFKDEGQFLPDEVQSMFVDWLNQYQNAAAQRAKDLERKIRDLTVRYNLYKDFLFNE